MEKKVINGQGFFDLKRVFPKLKILDAKVWRDHVDLTALGLKINEEKPAYKLTEIKKLKEIFDSVKVEGDAGVALYTEPEELTWDKLEKIAQSSKLGNATRLIISDVIKRLFQTEGSPTVKTRRVFLTNSVVEGSRKNLYIGIDLEKTFEEFEELLPTPLTLAGMVVLTYISSSNELPTYLYKDPTYSYCSGRILVGGFGAGGLHVTAVRPRSEAGIGAMWTIEPIL